MCCLSRANYLGTGGGAPCPSVAIEDIMSSVATEDMMSSVATEDITSSVATEDIMSSVATEDICPRRAIPQKSTCLFSKNIFEIVCTRSLARKIMFWNTFCQNLPHVEDLGLKFGGV